MATQTAIQAEPRARARALHPVIGLLFAVSGIPALVNQVAWQRILALHSGVGAFSVAVIVAAYMVGLGLGSLLGGALSRRLGHAGAFRAFALAELGIGLLASQSVAFYYEMPWIPEEWFRGTTWRVGLAHLLLLLPPTTLMGMTLPLLVRATVRSLPDAATVIGRLYGLNILGAALGALLTPWWPIPRFGLSGAVRFGVGCNAVVGLGALILSASRREDVGDDAKTALPETESAGRDDGGRRPFGLWVALYGLTGCLAVGLEVAWFRIIDVGVKATAYTFGTVLAVYLFGLAVGTLLAAGRRPRFADPLVAFLVCQAGILLSAGLSIVLLARLPLDAPVFRGWFDYFAVYEPLSPIIDGWFRTIWLYAGLPLALYGLPTILMGVSFGALQRGVQDETQTSGFKVGVLQAANIAGCVAGSLLVGLQGFAWPGTAETVRVLVGFGVVLAILGCWLTRSRLIFTMAALVLAATTWALPGQETFWRRIHGLDSARGLVMEDRAGVSSIREEGGRWRVSANGKGQSHLPFGGIHSKLGALPATLLEKPERIAVIGLGSGDTAWAAGCRPETQSLTVFEVCPGQRRLLDDLRAIAPDLYGLAPFLDDRRFSVVEADGRHALATSDDTYDLIEADAIRPNGAYSGNLYSREFFERCAKRLKPGGVMCTWSPTPRTRATFRQVFPHVLQLDNGVILIGSMTPLNPDPAAWRGRLTAEVVKTYLGQEALDECLRSLPSLRVLDPEPNPPPDHINTDLFPKDEYERPIQVP